MRRHILYIALILSLLQTTAATSPHATILIPPILKLVTVDHATSSATLTWLPGSPSGVSGYVVYRYRNSEGYAIDTIRDPNILTYTDYASGALFYSESYVVASFDAENNLSPLSNPLSTIFLKASIDTCNLKINLDWTLFIPVASTVEGYEILVSEGEAFESLEILPPTVTTRTIADFDFHASYIYLVRAILNDGQSSVSNQMYLSTSLLRPPSWIEISDVSINPSEQIVLTINYDPLSEISLFRLERMSENEVDYSEIALVNSIGGSFVKTDETASATKRHNYRVSAISSCNTMALTSLPAGNILLQGEVADYIITLTWNSYTGWLEGVDRYTVNISTGGSFTAVEENSGQDTTHTASYRDLMYDVTDESVCFFVAANRSNGVAGAEKPTSNRVCFGSTENIFVPNVFTPDGNGVNDSWRPVISFSPNSYYLVVRSRTGGTVYESVNYSGEWDGTYNMKKMPPDIYLWYLRLETPSGKKIEKSGTVAIIYNL